MMEVMPRVCGVSNSRQGACGLFPRIFYESERSEEAERSHASARSGKAAMPHGKPPIDASMVQQMVIR